MNIRRELITPEIAKAYLEHNTKNRSISDPTVDSYAEDMKNGRWCESTGIAISFDTNGVLADGQHRLLAIVKANVPIWSYVCTGCAPGSVYDENRVRSSRDNLKMNAEDLPAVFTSNVAVSMLKTLRQKSLGLGRNVRVSSVSLRDFISEHYDVLFPFFERIVCGNVSGVTNVYTFLALFLAYANGVNLEDIAHFATILKTGIPETKYDNTIILYRNRMVSEGAPTDDRERNARLRLTQNGLMHFLNKDGVSRAVTVDKLLWPWPFVDEAAA